ncbi:phosphodiesterase [Selenomonas sp. TAMA-11512]|uniref:phosphodiesterase n=1 Tax=Selenomonas sp. TAMA-11512 TaxID=3095337 RepID=UPI003092A469|nr:phosphodiesterase [Selenomonas sp. TAMA-11512]
MKVGFISDTHGSESRWMLAYNKYFKDADVIVHAGDVLYHGPRNPILPDYNPAKLAEHINAVHCPVIICRGNCDSEVDQLVLETPIQVPYALAFVDGRRIVVNHGHCCMSNEEKDSLAKAMKADIFVSGHIHTNVLEKRGETVFLNPGSPSLSKREDEKATVAVLEQDVVRIYDIDADEVLMELKI